MKPPLRRLRQTAMLSSGMLIAVTCLAASPLRADELSDMRAQMKAMKEANAAHGAASHEA